jgi:FkbM family methyltransferase
MHYSMPKYHRKLLRLAPSWVSNRRTGLVALCLALCGAAALLYSQASQLHARSVTSGETPVASVAGRSGASPNSPGGPEVLLRAALSSWVSGGMPTDVRRAAAACTTRDAADALLSAGDPAESGVIDVGANKGYPVTRLALQHGAAFVLSVEPDPRNFRVLSALRPGQDKTSGAVFIPVLGAAGSKTGSDRMSFHETRDDHTCFGCLDLKRKETYSEQVDVFTVDDLLLPGGGGRDSALWAPKMKSAGIALLKTDTQGYEAHVLRGARSTLASGRVRNVIMEFDAKLFHTRENALRALAAVFDVGMECTALKFAGQSSDDLSKGERVPQFTNSSINLATAGEFWDFVKAQGGMYTDVLCTMRPAEA